MKPLIRLVIDANAVIAWDADTYNMKTQNTHLLEIVRNKIKIYFNSANN